MVPMGPPCRPGNFDHRLTWLQPIVNLDNTIKTVGDLQQAIATATSNKVTLQPNSTGDGFQLVDQRRGAGQLTVA